MPRRAFRIAYDGRDYHGFQRQPDVPTVSDAVLDALRALSVLDAPGDGRGVPPGYAAAGRTDAGVSAVAQTVAFDAPDWLTPAALNAELPADVRAWASADAPEDFHATHDATARTYTYHLHAPGAGDGHGPAVVDRRARETVDALAGRHDFHNLTPDTSGTVREVSIDCERDGPFLMLTVRAGGFPRQLVRRLVTVVERVAERGGDGGDSGDGGGDSGDGGGDGGDGGGDGGDGGGDGGDGGPSLVERVLADEPLSGPEGIGPAPPGPLVLSAVDYPDLSFEGDADARASAREVFEQRRIAHATAARVTGDLAALGDGEGGPDSNGTAPDDDTGNTGR